MKKTQMFSALAILFAVSLSACASHEKTAKTSEDSASAQQRLAAENDYRQREQVLEANKRADAERQRQRMDEAAARNTKPD